MRVSPFSDTRKKRAKKIQLFFLSLQFWIKSGFSRDRSGSKCPGLSEVPCPSQSRSPAWPNVHSTAQRKKKSRIWSRPSVVKKSVDSVTDYCALSLLDGWTLAFFSVVRTKILFSGDSQELPASWFNPTERSFFW